MRFLLSLFLLIAVHANARQTESWDTILAAKVSKWEHLVFKRMLDEQSNVIAYVWEYRSDIRDRRLPGIYTQDVHCFFSARAQKTEDLAANVVSVSEDDTSFTASFKFDTDTGSGVSLLTIKIKVDGEKTHVSFSGSGQIYDEFMDYIAKSRQKALDEGTISKDEDLDWSYNDNKYG